MTEAIVIDDLKMAIKELREWSKNNPLSPKSEKVIGSVIKDMKHKDSMIHQLEYALKIFSNAGKVDSSKYILSEYEIFDIEEFGEHFMAREESFTIKNHTALVVSDNEETRRFLSEIADENFFRPMIIKDGQFTSAFDCSLDEKCHLPEAFIISSEYVNKYLFNEDLKMVLIDKRSISVVDSILSMLNSRADIFYYM